MDFQADHFQQVKDCRGDFHPASEQAGGAPQAWIRYVLPAAETLGAPEIRCRRSDLFDLIAEGPPIELACAAILAWGGMNRRHGQKLFADRAWLGTAEGVRRGEFTRAEAYEAFRVLRSHGKLTGMGPAYFTKLIFFLMPRSPDAPPAGYIMDQWTACSVNLLLDDPAAVLTDAQFTWDAGRALKTSFTVSDQNDGTIYDRFCRTIETLAKAVELDPAALELLLLSEGGRKPQAWRRYVKDKRRPPCQGMDGALK